MQAFNRDHVGVLVHHGKYGETHYYVPTEAHLHASALQLLSALKEGGWYEHLKFDPKESRIYGAKHPGMEPDEIAKLPEGPIRAAAVKAWKEYTKEQEDDQERDKEYRVIERALKNRDGELAWRILQERTGGEYERVSIERMETPEPLPRPKKPRHGCRWTDEDGQRWIFDGKKGRDLGWIKGAHAQWRAIYAAHEQNTLEPEVEEFCTHETLREVWSNIYAAERKDQVGGEAEPIKANPEDFEAAIQDVIDGKDHSAEVLLEMLTDPDEALKSGRAEFQRFNQHKVVGVLVSDKKTESIATREARWEKEDRARKKKRTS